MKDQRMSCDIISTLPSNIIETILSLLPIQEAVRTSIISRKWRYSWVTIPKLEFTKDAFKGTTNDKNQPIMKEITRRSRIFSAIYQTLLMHHGPIHEFSLTMNADESCFQIDQIILHLSKNHAVKKFKLHLNCGSYRLPLSILSFNQLTHLYLRDCNIDHFPTTCTGFGNLTSLHLEDVELMTENLWIISHSSLLRSVTLIQSELLYLCEWNIADLFSLPMIEYLAVSHSFIELHPNDVILRGIPTSLVHLKIFYFDHVRFGVYGSLGFLILLIRCSPNLEKINLLIDDAKEYDESYEIASIDYSGIWLEHLNKLEIVDFFNTEHEMEFVKLILIKSPVLKKVSIVLDSHVGKDEELTMLRNLLRFPCASPVVDIIVEHPAR